MITLAARADTPTPQRQQFCSADEQIDPVVIEPHTQAVSNQPRRHGVEHLAKAKSAGRRDGDDRLLIIDGPLTRQRLKHWPFSIDPFGVAGVLTADDLIDEAAITGQAVEIVCAAHQQSVLDGLLDVAVRALDRAVLVCDAAVVAGGIHAVMGAQSIVSPPDRPCR
jgi:hypothetical protein